jgi:hypothetical protein
MQTRGLDWIDDLPPELAAQRALLRGLLALCEADDRIRWLVIGCSLARGGKGAFEEFMSQPCRWNDTVRHRALSPGHYGAFRLRWVRMTP